ncbi:hypothetical protein LLG95_09255 [bacterium]|nr:hypothetical protein [bacterium]
MPLNDPMERDEDAGPLHEMAEAVKADRPPRDRYETARLHLLEKMNQIQKENPLMSALKNIARPGPRWATATGLIIILIAGVLVFNPFGRNPSQAFAAVAEQFRKAVTVSFSATYALDENQSPVDYKIAFREPSLDRFEMVWQGNRIIQVNDTANNKGLILMPDAKTGNETELASMPSSERERLGLVKMLTQTVKNLPAQADAILDERTIDGRKVTGYRVGEQTFWIDVHSKTLIQMEKSLGGRPLVMKDFRLDPPELDEAAFSLKLPAGYTAMTAQPLKLDYANVGEEDLVKHLRLVSSVIQGHKFPASTNPMELLTLGKEGKLDFKSLPAEQARSFSQDYAQSAQRMVTFSMSLKPENDFHYAGEGVTFGDAKTPIAWWKPTGLANYRVIWGDLRITEEPASIFAKAPKR